MVYFDDTFSCEEEAEATAQIGEIRFKIQSLNQLLEELVGRSGAEAKCQKLREEIRHCEDFRCQLEGTAVGFYA